MVRVCARPGCAPSTAAATRAAKASGCIGCSRVTVASIVGLAARMSDAKSDVAALAGDSLMHPPPTKNAARRGNLAPVLLGRQALEYQGMSARPAPPPGRNKLPQVPRNADSKGFARARTVHRSRPDPGALGPHLRAPA